MNTYIKLTSASIDKKFHTLYDGSAAERSKPREYQVTVTGKISYQVAPILRRWHYNLLLYGSDEGSDYAIIDDLQDLFDLGKPSERVLTLTDHWNNTYQVVMVGSLNEKNLSPSLTTGCAYFQVPVTLEQTT